VDPDYTGEIKVLLVNAGLKPFYVRHEMRIAQAMIVPFGTFPFHEVTSFPTTDRGDKGFGSTGD
jgi:dUTP pyrophosphatase